MKLLDQRWRGAAVAAVSAFLLAGILAVGASGATAATGGTRSHRARIAKVAPRVSGPAARTAYDSVRTLLSGPASPSGIALDSAGDVFMVYANLAEVVEVPKGATKATTVWSNLAPPASNVAVDAAGDLFVTSSGSVLELPKGASSPTFPNFSGLGDVLNGVAADGAGDLFVSDTTHDRVVERSKGGNQTDAGFTGLVDPGGLAVDTAGDLFVVDAGRGLASGRVVELTKAGTQTTLALAGVSLPTAVAVDGSGDVFVSAVNLGVVELPAGGSQKLLDFPGIFGAVGVAVDPTGDVFVTDAGTNMVEELPPGGAAAVFPPNATASPSGLATDAAGNLYISDFGNSQVLKLTPGGILTRLRFFGLDNPGSVAVDVAGDVFVADTGNDRVVELTNGSQLTLPFTGLETPTGLAVDRAGDVFVTEGQNVGVLELAKGGVQKTLPFTGLHNPTSVAIDQHGNVYVADAGIEIEDAPSFSPQLFELPSGGGPQTTVLPASDAPDFGVVAVDDAGDVFATAGLAGSTTDVVVLPFGGTPGSAVGLAIEAGSALAVDSAGDVFTAQQADNLVQELPIDQATFVNPVNGQLNVDTTQPFTWSTIPAAQGYYLIVGTTLYGKDLVNSGVLPASQSSYSVGVLPAGRVLYATLFTEESGTWSRFQVVGFTAAQRAAALTYPVNGEANVDTTRPFTWTADAGGAQAYILVVGTTKFGTNLVNSGPLPGNQLSFAVPSLPGGILYATLLTEIDGTYSRYVSAAFTAASGGAVFTHPVEAEHDVTTPGTFTWSAVANAQGFQLIVGTTLYGHDLVNSAVLSPTTTGYAVGALPAGGTLYATIYTEVHGAWVNYNAVGFTSAVS